MPPSILLNVDTRFKLTIPSGKFPLDLHIVVKEKVMNEYDVSVILLIIISLPKGHVQFFTIVVGSTVVATMAGLA